MSTVVKIGGALLEDPSSAVAQIRRVMKPRTAIVHGGGKQISRMLEQMKVESTFIEGLRVTDEKTLNAVAMALMGEVHTALLLEFAKHGVPAVGMFGSVQASKKTGPWGLVGTKVRADSEALAALLDAGKLPVIPTLAIGESSLLNVNGDETASAVAIALKADELIFLTDVEGVRDSQGNVFEQASRPDELLKASFVTGGMIPKLRAVKAAMDAGIQTVRVGRTVFGNT
jgi:acetylglutamate kinase